MLVLRLRDTHRSRTAESVAVVTEMGWGETNSVSIPSLSRESGCTLVCKEMKPSEGQKVCLALVGGLPLWFRMSKRLTFCTVICSCFPALHVDSTMIWPNFKTQCVCGRKGDRRALLFWLF